MISSGCATMVTVQLTLLTLSWFFYCFRLIEPLERIRGAWAFQPSFSGLMLDAASSGVQGLITVKRSLNELDRRGLKMACSGEASSRGKSDMRCNHTESLTPKRSNR